MAGCGIIKKFNDGEIVISSIFRVGYGIGRPHGGF